LKKILLAVLLCVLPVTVFAWTAGKAHKWGAIATHGGAAGALDTIAGVSVTANDTAHVVTGTTVYSYYAWVAGATSQANEPWIVCPDDLQLGGHGITGTTLWVLADSGVSTLDVQHKIYVAGIRWDNGAGLLNGENIADDTIDDDSIDFTDVTLSDFTNDENYLDKDTDTYLAGTTNHAALHNSGGDWELNHDNLAGFVASEHLDWTADQGATNIHADNIPDLSAVYEPEGITAADIDDLNVGTDITADLEEETHATEHESGGADEMQLSDMASGTSDIMDKTGDAGMIANWNTAYGWGDHGAVGYLTGTTDHHVLHEAGGAWELDIANLASGTSKVYDKSTDVMTALNSTAWRVFYTDAAGDLTELALGANGEYLKSQGNAAVPTWDTPAGGGGLNVDMSNVSGTTAFSAVTEYKCWTLLSPEEMISGNTPIPIFTVDENMYPNGIELVSVSLEVTSGNTTFAVTYEEWDHSHQADIETVTSTNGVYTVVRNSDIDNRQIDAGDRIYIHPDTSKSHSIHGCFGFYPR